MVAHTAQEPFLANEHNKTRFIALLTKTLQNAGYEVRQAVEDADTDIVSAALQFTARQQNVTVIADDTDVLILLIHHYQPHHANIHFKSKMKLRDGKVKLRHVNIRLERERLGSDVADRLLFIHAWGGCDTVSALYGKGKLQILNKVKQSNFVRSVADVFCCDTSTQEDIAEAGFKLIVNLYGGKSGQSLNSLRYIKYMDTVAKSKSSIRPEVLPPSERAAFFHCLRIFLQIMQWKILSPNQFNPADWGWKLEGSEFVPITTDMAPAPEDILNVVRCRCKSSSKRQCGVSTSCSCRKHGLKCVSACGECHGMECLNQSGIIGLLPEDTNR